MSFVALGSRRHGERDGEVSLASGKRKVIRVPGVCATGVGRQCNEPDVKESMEVQLYDATPLMIEQYSKLPTRDEPYQFGHPGALLQGHMVGPDGLSQRARALLVRVRLDSRYALANRECLTEAPC